MKTTKMKCLVVIYFLTFVINISFTEFLKEPHLQTIDGHLYIFGANDKNVSFMVSPKGYVNVNGENLYKVVKEAKEATTSIFSLKYTMLNKLEEDIKYVTLSMNQMSQKLNICETFIQQAAQTGSGNAGGLPFQYLSKINKLERRVKTILRNLAKQECERDPCLNGGICHDKYLDYECRCLEGWEGKMCEKDVNECAKFAGSDLGCQNGATCINKPGSYECVCAPGWYGLHCMRRSNDCSSASSTELCGHGICVTQATGNKGFTCICDQGWKTDGINPACSIDVDECTTYPCSRNPLVTCHNIPGNFFCGSCPYGYSGNGFSCTDINECLVQNGGCSTQPMVQCINTDGSNACGPCPPGYIGDGRTCTFVGKCQINNGGCNVNAKCEEIGSSIQCQCLPGYTGTGIGLYGCEPSNPGTSGNENLCNPNPCKNNGRCYVTSSNSFTCVCPSGFTGHNCATVRNFCSSNPCQNGGTCTQRGRIFYCKCTSSYTGRLCQREKQACGGYLSTDEGELQFPPSNSSSTTYSHNLNCAWVIMVNNTLVINVTFDYFDLELAPECEFDWVQIHDGKSAGDHIIGKFCGNSLPNNGTIISTTNYMYMWFKSDGSKSKNGFKLSWKAVNPVCGGAINASIHGTIRSPGSPGKYPPNRDCLWQVTAPLGHRITFTFFEVHIETHPNCSFDYLEFYEGLTLTSPLLRRYCNSTVPQPLITPGNTALVYFHSDQYQSDKGFQIAFHPTPGYPGCGGIFTSRRGELSPPTEEGRYIKNMDCAWLIRLTGNLRIRVEFTSFKLEDGTNCNNDFVEIREGSDISSPLIGRYCGFVAPPPIESEGNVLFVRFYSDSTIQSEGFRISYKAVCSETFTSESGVIQSPGYPNKYRNQEDCIFIVEQPPGKIIELQFQDFEFEAFSICAYDYIEIRDGHSENSPLIKRYCGLERPPKIISTHNYLWIKMVTDKDIEMRGFYANYTTTDISCGGICTASEGVIRSPFQEGSYPPNHNCRWAIVGKVGEIIQITFTSFHLEYHAKCEFDYVEVYDNSSNSQEGGLMGRFCGETVPPLLTTTDNVMTIIFHSDASLSMEGFSASYKIINVSTICGGNYFTNVGVIKSPNYPKLYPHGKTCIWVIRVSYGNKITLKADIFWLEGNDKGQSEQCTFDYLEIRDGGYEMSPLIGRYCGMKFPKQIVSQSNALFLKFKSDNTFSSLGFRLRWDGSLTGCGGTLTSMSGSIISPNYPEPYGASSLCIYKIFVALGSKINLNIMDLDLENVEPCSLDFIEIFDGSDKSGKSLGKLCSNTNHPARISSISNQMTIKFQSDVSAAGKGFFLKYKSECNTNITGYRGVIESPNFPDKIPPGTNCTWIISAPRGNKINISFSDFNFMSSCEDHFIEVREGNLKPTNTIGKFCRNNKPLLLSSSLEKVFITLITSQDSLYGSFRLEWVVNGCGGTFIKPFGDFQSPNYPNLYPPNTLCEYYITVDPSQSIKLDITNINMEALKGCFGDYLAVYGGSDATAPLLAKLCQKQSEPVTIESSGNTMYIKFISDLITAGTGFFASYSSQPAKCGGYQKSNQGRIHSRNYPKNYNAMDNCEWKIEVDANHKIRLNFEDFDLASDSLCNTTYIEVFDGPTKNFPLLLKHCGSTIPKPNPLFSSSNFLTIYMRTDQGYTAKGFSARFEMECGAVIVINEPGIITPSYYLTTRENNENCTWILTSPDADGHVTVTVTVSSVLITEIGLESNDICTDNTLFVYDGSDHNSTLLGAYCRRKTHLPITSKGNVMFLELYNNYPGDVYFWATYSSASSSCGGILHGEAGSFASPGYPNSYPANSECIWTITSAPGNKIELSFKEFDIEESEHCNEEYLEIREKDGSGKLFGVFCGQNSPSNVTSSNEFWIKFRSSKTGTGKKGFLADYSPVYNMELNGTYGQIANPSYPRPFMHFINLIYWRITVSFGSSIRINFKEVQLEDLYSMVCITSVTIFDGYDETAPELLKVCGMVKPDIVTSSSNVIYIQFSHFQVHRGSLFLLEWSEVPRLNQLATVSPTGYNCGNQIDLTRNMSVLIENPGWPEPYTQTENCEWVIQCPYYEHLVFTVQVLSFPQNYECNYIYLRVETKMVNDEWKELRKFCLSNETDQTVSTSNLMKLYLRMGYSSRVLFSVMVHRECGNSISKSDGVIKFNWRNYTHYSIWYREDFFCHWDITVSPGKTIAVVFTEFDFGNSETSCTDKYVMLRNGGSNDSPILGQGVYCNFPGVIPHTTSNKLYIKAKSSYRDASFVMKFTEVSPNCGQRFKLDENFNVTIISSPNYPNIPPSKIECIWTFTTTGEHRIQIDFLERFDLTNSDNCNEEYVEIRDGGTSLSEELGRFCSSKPSTQKSSGNMMFVKYYTNSTNPKNGFKAQVSLARCGGIIRSDKGVLTSPNYPNNYLYDIECRWEIEVDDEYKVQISFVDLDLPLNSTDEEISAAKFSTQSPNLNQQRWVSFLPNKNQSNCTSSALISILEPGPEEEVKLPFSFGANFNVFANIFRTLKKTSLRKDVLLGNVCSNDPTIPIRASANRIIIEFQSGQARHNSLETLPRGFKLNFTNAGKGCSQKLDTPNGIITSPGYPNLRPDYYFCTWKIRTTKGRRVTLKVQDFDLPNDSTNQRVMFYHDLRARSLYEVLLGTVPVGTTFKSSTNQMLVSYWSSSPSGSSHRGFKFSYNSDEPAICGGIVTSESGYISSPTNVSSFYCRWEFLAKKLKNQTMVFYVKDAIITKLKYCSIRASSVLAITSKAPGKLSTFKYEMCGNVTSQIIRNPLPLIRMTAIKASTVSSVVFNVTYKTFDCGGVISDPKSIITSPNYPNNYPPDMDCAWLISVPSGQTFKLTFSDFSLQPSCDDYLIVRNGPSAKSPLINQFCGSNIDMKTFIQSEGSSLFLEFHSDSKTEGKGFKIGVEPANYVCGGAFHSENYDIMSPNFPSEYDNNQECEWELISVEGTHIGLVFEQRFHIESSENCKNDFVKVYDFVDDDWKLLKTLCGRELPETINSTSNRLKVLFRSNNAITSDGFRASWYQNCGGVLTSKSGVIRSPGYPGLYPGDLNCTYIIEPKDENVFLNFTFFSLEPAYKGRCQFDAVTISEEKYYGYEELVGIFCGSQKPGFKIFRNKVKINFFTDLNNNYEGFVLYYNTTSCGGQIKTPNIISYILEKKMIDILGYDWGICTWNIEAPADKIIILRFDMVNIPFSNECSYPYIDVSENKNNNSISIGRICGLLAPKQVILKSTTNKVTVSLQKPTIEGGGFSATVFFTYGKAAGCGGEVFLDDKPITIQSPDVNGDGLYEEYMDCTWILRARPLHQIEANFKSFEVHPCKKINGTNFNETCQCDYVELRDGGDYYSEVLLFTCGSSIPSSVISSGSVIFLRLSTDGTFNSRGFTVQFTSKLSQCGIQLFEAKDNVQTLTSPNYPKNYFEGLNCKWIISDDSDKSIHLHISEWDIVESANCKDDYLFIEDTGNFKPLYQSQSNGYLVTSNKSEGATEIIRGNPTILGYYDKTRVGRTKFCGKGNSVDYYSESKEVTVGFFSNSGRTKKGFRIEYSIAGCTRNYTAEQGRIKSLKFMNNSHCYITITAASSNHTISLYFDDFILGKSEHGSCSSSFLEVRDGPDVKSPLIGKYCGYQLPNPVFSNGQYLWLHFYTVEQNYQRLDLTYTTTDKGKGCGGRIFGLSGTITSPGYPSNVRQNTVCRWDVTVPSFSEEILTFYVFDIGPASTCSTDYIEFYEVTDTNQEILLSRFCGKDNPATIRSTANSVAIKYYTSLHNGGTGWKLAFRSVAPGTKFYEM